MISVSLPGEDEHFARQICRRGKSNPTKCVQGGEIRNIDYNTDYIY